LYGDSSEYLFPDFDAEDQVIERMVTPKRETQRFNDIQKMCGFEVEFTLPDGTIKVIPKYTTHSLCFSFAWWGGVCGISEATTLMAGRWVPNGSWITYHRNAAAEVKILKEATGEDHLITKMMPWKNPQPRYLEHLSNADGDTLLSGG
jgi:hypothetical protein